MVVRSVPATSKGNQTAPARSRKLGSSVYFSHPIKSYGSAEEEEILKALKREFEEVVNPKDFPPPDKWGSCRDCMERTMKGHFFPMIKKCENLVIWTFSDTCGIECELHYAWGIGKKIYRVEPGFDWEDTDFDEITLQEYNVFRRYS